MKLSQADSPEAKKDHTVSIIANSIMYWEKEKLKTLQRGAAKGKRFHVTIHKLFSESLPRWEKKVHKRLGQVQILLEPLDDHVLTKR